MQQSWLICIHGFIICIAAFIAAVGCGLGHGSLWELCAKDISLYSNTTDTSACQHIFVNGPRTTIHVGPGSLDPLGPPAASILRVIMVGPNEGCTGHHWLGHPYRVPLWRRQCRVMFCRKFSAIWCWTSTGILASYLSTNRVCSPCCSSENPKSPGLSISHPKISPHWSSILWESEKHLHLYGKRK